MALVFKPTLSFEEYTATIDALASLAKRYAEAADKAVTPKGKEILKRYSLEASATLAKMHSVRAELAESI